MPSSKYPNRKRNRRKLQGPKELLIRRHSTKEALGRLCQPKNSPEVYEKTRAGHCKYKDILAPRVDAFAEGDPEQQQYEQEQGKGKGLRRETGKQDVVARVRVFRIGLRGSNYSGASYLHDGCQNIRRDEAPQYQLG